MKLYLIPSACSLASHILVREANLDVELIKIDLAKRELPDGTPYASVAPKGQVAALTLDNGELLTENIAILSYLGSLAPDHLLMPKPGTLEYFRAIEWLTFVATEIHKLVFWTFFNAATPKEHKEHVLSLLPQKFDTLEYHLADREFIAAPQFMAPDAYLAWVFHMLSLLKIELGDRPALTSYRNRLLSREAVRQAIAFEAA